MTMHLQCVWQLSNTLTLAGLSWKTLYFTLKGIYMFIHIWQIGEMYTQQFNLQCLCALA